MNRRWKIYRMPDRASSVLGHTHDEIHEGCERSLSRRISELEAVTRKRYRYEEILGDDSQGSDTVSA